MSENIKVVAMGGGAPLETMQDSLKRGLDLSGVDRPPNTLIIPTPKVKPRAFERSSAHTSAIYEEVFKVPYRELHAFGEFPNESVASEQLEWADVVYVPGGDTDHMMKVWRSNGFDALLKTQVLGGLVLTGSSAGAIASFAWGHSDSLSYRVPKNEPWDYIRVDGLDLLHAAVTPHYNTNPTGVPRAALFEQMFNKQGGVRYGFGLDEFAGVEVSDGLIRPLAGPDNAGVTILDATGAGLGLARLASDEVLPLSQLE